MIGGWNSSRHQVLEMTEENRLAWMAKANLPADRSHAVCEVYDGKIWVIGGVVGERMGSSASVLTYNADADAWETAPPLPSPQCVFAAATTDGRLLLCGETALYEFKDAAWSVVDRYEERIHASHKTAGRSVLLG